MPTAIADGPAFDAVAERRDVSRDLVARRARVGDVSEYVSDRQRIAMANAARLDGNERVARSGLGKFDFDDLERRVFRGNAGDLALHCPFEMRDAVGRALLGPKGAEGEDFA